MKCAGQSQEMEGRAIPNAALDPTHVAPADSCGIRQCFLRYTLILPKLPYPVPHPSKSRMFWGLQGLPGHPPMFLYCILSDHARSDTT